MSSLIMNNKPAIPASSDSSYSPFQDVPFPSKLNMTAAYG